MFMFLTTIWVTLPSLFFPSVPSSYMYFLTVFFPILQSPFFTALFFCPSIFGKHESCTLSREAPQVAQAHYESSEQHCPLAN